MRGTETRGIAVARLSRASLIVCLAASACSGGPYTDVRITVRFDGALGIEQLRFSGRKDGSALFDDTTRPAAPAGPLASDQSIALVVDDTGAGEIDLEVTGLRSLAPIAWGSAPARPTSGKEIAVDVTLGTTPPDWANGDGGVLVISTTSLPDAMLGAPYGADLHATGSGGTLAWSIVAGTLPSGLALSADGVIFGTPLTAGRATFTVEAQAGDGRYATETLDLSVVQPGVATLSILTRALPEASAGKDFSGAITATGGTPPYVFALAAGTLPEGLALASSGTLGGAAATGGEADFVVQATDSSMPAQLATATLSLVVAPASGTPLRVTTTVLPAARVGQPLTAAFAAAGGTPPYRFALAGDVAPPPGLQLSSDGMLLGTPAAAGNYALTPIVADRSLPSQAATRVITLNVADSVAGANLTLTTGGLRIGTVGVGYSTTLSASGGLGPYLFSLAAGALPPGLTLSDNGLLAGTPDTQGSFDFTIAVSDASTPQQSAARSFTLSVVPLAGSLMVTTAMLPDGMVGAPWAFALAATGGTAPYGWSLGAGALPDGLTLAQGGAIGGTPEASGTFTFTLQARDSKGAVAARQLAIAVTPAAQSLLVTTPALADAKMNTAYAQTLTAAGGLPPYGWAIMAGALPTGITLNAGTGALTGTPISPGTWVFTATVADSSQSPLAASRALSINVRGMPNQLVIATTLLPAAVSHVAYSATVTATGGTPPYQWQLAHNTSLPAGLALAPDTGILSGTPAVAGSFAFSLSVIDNARMFQSATRNLTLFVADAALSVTTASLAPATLGVPYNSKLSASGGSGSYTWSIVAGTFPLGLNLNNNSGVINGKAGARGTFDFTVGVRDSMQAMAQQALSITVN